MKLLSVWLGVIKLGEIISLKCPNCGAPMQEGAKACTYCGVSIQYSESTQSLQVTGILCMKCNKMNSTEAQYCEKCATRLKDACHHCNKLIAVSSDRCPYCGSFHYGNIEQMNISEEDWNQAYNLSARGLYSEAESLYRKFEQNSMNSDIFYGARIYNYMRWGMSLDSNSTMYDFSRHYRNKAKELLEIAQRKYPTSAYLNEAGWFVTNNWQNRLPPPAKSGCFIATVVYGDPFCYEVCTLRSWRDNTLSKSRLGQMVIALYYSYGPTVANWTRENASMKIVFRKIFDIFIESVLKKSNK